MRIFVTVLGDELMLKKMCAELYVKQAVLINDLFLNSSVIFTFRERGLIVTLILPTYLYVTLLKRKKSAMFS